MLTKRPMISLRTVLLSLLFLSLHIPALLRAQSWQADFSSEGTPPEDVWRYDRSYFVLHEGWLQLQAPEPETSDQATIMTNVHLPASPVWTGRVRLDLEPTSRNYSYVLLAVSKVIDAQTFEYIALDFGGYRRGCLALLQIVLTRHPSPTHPQITYRSPSSVLISSKEVLSQGHTYDYRVSYTPSSGWELALRDVTRGGKFESVGTNEAFLPELVRRNTFGLSCTFTMRHTKDWAFRDLRIYPAGEGTPDEGEAPQPPHDPNEGGQSGPTLLLSEVMPRPKAKSPEYIELYNVADTDCELSDFLLAVGRDEQSYRTIALPQKSISAKSYIVITKDPEALASTYPQAPREKFVQAPLPRLLNKSGLIALVKGEDQVIDLLHYSEVLLPRGLKTKAGVALERRDYTKAEEEGNWKAASASSGYATPGMPNSLESSSDTSTSDKGERTTLADLLQTLEASPLATCSFGVYTMTGILLARGNSLAKDSWLKNLRTTPLESLRLLVRSASGPFILHVTLHPKEGEKIERSLVFRLPPN